MFPFLAVLATLVACFQVQRLLASVYCLLSCELTRPALYACACVYVCVCEREREGGLLCVHVLMYVCLYVYERA